MAMDPLRNPRVELDPWDEATYHEVYQKLTPDQVDVAKKALLNPTKRDIVKYWEVKERELGGQA